MKLRPDVQAEADRMANAALGQSEPGVQKVNVSDRSDSAANLGRWPCIGLHAGAIDGTTPHRQRRLDMWRPRR